MFTFPAGAVGIDPTALVRYPREYRALAYVLDQSGFPVQRTFATKGSDLEHDLTEHVVTGP